MKRNLPQLLLTGLLLAAVTTVHLTADEAAPAQDRLVATEEAVLVSITASVEAIDHQNRQVTLKGPLGNTVTFAADPRVKRLKEVKVGDLVAADYYISIAAELRKPTPAEEQEPLVLLEAAAKAPPGTSPAGGGLRRFKVVTTVEGLDRPTETITVRGPGGNYLTARVKDPARLTETRIGETIVITYTEALAISLEKVRRD